MLKAAEDLNVIWPDISEDIREYLGDCGCAMSKNNRRKSKKWGTSEAVLPEDTSYALDLYTYSGKIYLSIVHLSTDTYWCLEVHEKKAETITALLDVWSESLGLEFHELTFLTDRGGGFEELSAYVKGHVKTAAYHPEANGKVERRHNEISMLCRLFDCDPPAVAEMWHIGSYGVFQVKALPEVGELVLRYNQRMGAKHLDPWSGPFIVQARVGRPMVKCLILDTKKIVYIHLNDLRNYKRPDTREWRLSDSEIKRITAELDLEFGNFTKGDLDNPWKNRDILVDISDAADLEMIFAKALKEQPKRILIVIPEWKERKFFDIHSAIHADFISVSHDADAFIAGDDPAGFRIWNCWVGCYTLKDLRKAARDSGWIKALMSGTEGEVLRLDAPEEEHAGDSAPAHAELSEHSERMFENI